MGIDLTTILSSIFTFTSGMAASQTGNSIFNTIKRRRLKKIEDTSEFKKLFDEHETDFKESFILPNLKEEYFYIKTGISTNEKSIDKYINFKNKIAKNYTWEHINSIISFLDLSGDHIILNLKKNDKRKANSIVGVFLFTLLLLPSSLIFNWFEFSQKHLFLFITWMITLAYLMYLIYTCAGPILTAKSIEKRLLQLENNII